MMTLLLVLHFMVCFILIAVVLLQRGKGADLGAALGGGGANTVFGSRGAGNFLTRLTTGSAILFMLTSLSLAYLGTQQSEIQLFDENEAGIEEGSPALDEVPDAAATSTDQDLESDLEEFGDLEEIDPEAPSAEP